MNKLSDEKLLEKYNEVSDIKVRQEIFLSLFKRHNNRIISRVRAHLNNNIDDAEEVVQEVWIGVLRSLEKGFVLYKGSFGAWLHGVVHNKIVDLYRKNKPLTTLEFVPHSNHSVVIENEMKEILSLCIAKFPHKYQTVLFSALLPKETKKWYKINLTSQMIQCLLNEICVLEISDRFRESAAEITKRLSTLLEKNLQENTVKVQRYRSVKMLQECLSKHNFSDGIC